MASHANVINLSTGQRVKRSQAKRMVEHQCAYRWTCEGNAIEKLTLQETIEARTQFELWQQQQAAVREYLKEPLAYAEIPGLTFEPPASGLTATRMERIWIREARTFALAAI